MAFNISDKTLGSQLNRHLEDARAQEADALERLSSGSRFTRNEPMPAERAIAESMEHRIRSLSSSKRNINDAISLLQTAEGSMSEVTNMITRMKEINIAAASTTLNDQERRYLFIEYEAIHDEINRIAATTEFNGIPLLNGASEKAPEELLFRIEDPFRLDGGEDINTIRFTGLKSVNATTAGLGLHSAKELLADTSDEEGIHLEDVEEMLIPENEDAFSTSYDQALANLSTQRAIFGALQTRLNYALDYLDVYQENIAAAKSKIADTDYAEEVSKMLEAKIRISATTSLLAQSNVDAKQIMQLFSKVVG